MRIKPHDKVIDLLVGELLYTSPDAVVRELLQNAEDACALQEIKDTSSEAEILVRYSRLQNFVEVKDNGLGMNSESIELSFASVGAPKDEVTHIRELMERAPNRSTQIALFGIGILSCFGVAQSIEVRTKMEEDEGLRFRINDVHEDFDPTPDQEASRGTVVRLELKPDGPMRADMVPDAVRRYARHAAHVLLEDADSGEREAVSEHSLGADRPGVQPIEDPALRRGILALDDAWDNMNVGFQSRLTVCNGGFLVAERETALLPQQMFGYIGEIDVEPGKLNILLNREGFKHDEKWQQLGQRLADVYNQLIRARLAEWEERIERQPDLDDHGSIERATLLLASSQIRGLVAPDLQQQIDSLLPHVVHVKLWDSEESLPIASAIDRARPRGVLYYVREGEGVRQMQQSVAQDSGTVQVTETAQTETLRATHLRLRGAVVVVCKQHTFSVEIGESTQQIAIHDADVIQAECSKAELQWISVIDAPPQDVQLGAIDESVLISGLLEFEEGLNLIVLPGMPDRVVRDYAGRLLNCSHPEVQEILRMLPNAIGNPVWRALLQTYMDIDNFYVERARRRVKELLSQQDLHEQAEIPTGRLTTDYLREKLASLLEVETSSG